MKRRNFIAMGAMLAPILAKANESEIDNNPSDKWWELVKTVDHSTVKSAEGDIELEVSLVTPPKKELTEIKGADSLVTGFTWKGEKMPKHFWPGSSLIRKFELRWKGKEIPIAPQFWADLTGLTIQTVLERPKVQPDDEWRYAEFLGMLVGPRILPSADGETALLSWEGAAESDGSSMVRWIISPSGTVLRHRELFEPGC